MNVGNVILLRSAPGRNCDIMDRRTAFMSTCLFNMARLERSHTILVPLFHDCLLFLLLHIFCWRLIAIAYRERLKVELKGWNDRCIPEIDKTYFLNSTSLLGQQHRSASPTNFVLLADRANSISTTPPMAISSLALINRRFSFTSPVELSGIGRWMGNILKAASRYRRDYPFPVGKLAAA